MIYYYGNELSPNQIETIEGFLICKNVPIARTGVQIYTARDLNLDGDPERLITVNRYETDVFETAAVASFEGKPVTDGHPPEEVEPYNFSSYAKGHIQRVRREGELLLADLYINDPVLINDVRNGVKREISCGYICEYAPDGNGFKQTKIRGNHVAVVPRGRAGHEVSIRDEAPKEIPNEGGKSMGKFAQELLKVFGTATKDASPEEIEEMAKTTANVLEAEPEKSPEAEPTKDVMVERAPKGDDLGTKLDRILELLEHHKEEKEEKKELSDESDIDEMIKRLDGGEKSEDKTPLEKEEAVTVPAETMEDACSTADAIAILKRVRPAVAAIKDKNERARVTDVLLSVFANDNQMASIFKATKDSARKAAGGSDPNKAIEEQQKAYDSLNPHKKA